MTASSDNELCRSLNIRQQHTVAWQRTISPGYAIAIRPVCLHNNDDLEMIGKWVEQGYGVCQQPDQLRIIYTIIAECTYMQSIIIMLNHEFPVCVADIGDVTWDEVIEYYDACPGDFRLQLPVLPVFPGFPNLVPDVIETCLDYFFSYPGVRRIVWTIYADETSGIETAQKTGFQLLDTLSEKGRPMRVYIVSREN
jgi:hypothetical protein